MKNKIGMTILLSLLLLSLLVVPVVGAADGNKVLVKEMVQSPEDYSVNSGPGTEFERVSFTPFWRLLMYDFTRLPGPCWDWKYGVGC